MAPNVMVKLCRSPSSGGGPMRPQWAMKSASPRQGAMQWVRDRDLLGMPCRESGYLFSGLWRGNRERGEGKRVERERMGRGEGRSGEKGERQKLPLSKRDRKEGAQTGI